MPIPRTPLNWGSLGSLAFLLAVGQPHLGIAQESRGISVAKEPTERRIALLIGNDAYPEAPLRNPTKDARSLAEALKAAQFQVTVRENLTQKQILRALLEFGDELRKGGIGLFYFSGHGIQINNRNYLLPVGATFERPEDIEIEGVDASAIMRRMEAAQNQLNIVVLDACRNNPFAKGLKRDLSRGLARMEAPSGTLVAYATEPGSTASDGAGDNGLYTKHLITNIKVAGVPLEQVFKRVRVGVEKESKGEQRPREDNALKGEDFYFFPPAPAKAAVPAGPDPAAIELSFWESVRTSTMVEDFQAYLDQFPTGRFAVLARNRIRSLKALATANQPTPVEQAPKIEPTRPVTIQAQAPPPSSTHRPEVRPALQVPRPAEGNPPLSSLPDSGARPGVTGAQPASTAPPLPSSPNPSPTLTSPKPIPSPARPPSAQASPGVAIQSAPTSSIGQIQLQGHDDAIWAVQAAASGEFIASAGWDKQVRVWKATGAPAFTFPTHKHYFESLALSPDDKRIAAGTYQGILIYSMDTRSVVRFLPLGDDWITSVAFSPDGKLLAAGSKDKFVHVVDIERGTILWKGNKRPEMAITAVAWDPSARKVLAGDSGGTLQVFSAEGEFQTMFGLHMNAVTSILLGKGSMSSVVISAGRDGSVKAWDLQKRRTVWSNQDFSAPVNSLSLIAKSQELAVACFDRKVHILSLNTGKEVRALEGHTGAVTAIALNPKDNRLISGSDDRTVRLWPAR